MIGARPSVLRSPYGTPGIVADEQIAAALTPGLGMQPAAEPFVWGAGGAKLTPDQVAALRAQGEAMTQGDYSPVGHWLQGLGRVADNIDGAFRLKRAERMEGENAARDADFAEAIASGRVDDATIARVLMDPNAGSGVKQFAGMEYQRRQPKASAPTEIEKLMLARGIPQGSPEWNKTLEAVITGKTDPFTVIQAQGGTFMGPQSLVQQALQGGGGQASGAQPGGEPPAVLPPDFDFGDGGPASAPDPFRPR